MLANDKQMNSPPFSFLSALSTPAGHAQVQYVLLHTVNRELDGLKKDPKFRLMLSDFLRDVRSRASSLVSPLDGLRARCIQQGVLVELSEEEAEMEVMYGGHYRSCDLQGPDAMILNVAWYLFNQIKETYGARSDAAVVLVTNDANMLHWAQSWKLPCASFDSMHEAFKQEEVHDLSSAATFLRCAGIESAPVDPNTGSSLHEVFSHAQLRSSMTHVQWLESVIPKLRMIVELEAMLKEDTRHDIPASELRAVLGLPTLPGSPSHDATLVKRQSLAPPVPTEVDEEIPSSKKILEGGLQFLDQIRAGLARTGSMAATQLGQKAMATSHHRTGSRISFS
jgi:hypothetical protein